MTLSPGALENREALTLQKDPKGGIDQWIGFHGKK